jgi:hypothetical protein
VYELASHLIKRYSGSGKTFYLAAEQADLQMRQQPSGNAAAVTAATPLDAERQELLIKLWWEQQAAVDDARVDHAEQLKGVQVRAAGVCVLRVTVFYVDCCMLHAVSKMLHVE